MHARSFVLLISNDKNEKGNNLEFQLKSKFISNFNLEICLLQSIDQVCELIVGLSNKVYINY